MACKHSQVDLFILCGEKSGDLIASKVLEPLTSSHRLKGVIGPALKNLGVEEAFSIDSLEVMGFIPVLKKLPSIMAFFQKVKREILRDNPKGVLLVDNAEFSLLMGRALRKSGYKGKILQLISPSVWAWRKGRKKTLEKYFDAILSIFPFEESFFEGSPLLVKYIGHPLAEELYQYPKKNELPELSGKRIIALFPGSRRKETQLNLPLQLDAVKNCKEHTIAIGVSSPKVEKEIKKILHKKRVPALLIPSENRYELMQKCELALAKFGTINLELALLEVPTITAFPLPFFERFLLEGVFKIFLPHYSIVNLLAKRRIFPEYVAAFATIDNLTQEVKNYLANPLLKQWTIDGCKEVKNILSSASLSSSAKEVIINLI